MTTLGVTAPAITVSGVASDSVGVTQVTWWSSSGIEGIASGTESWIVHDIPLLTGANTIIIRAWDAAGNFSWRSLIVTRR